MLKGGCAETKNKGNQSDFRVMTLNDDGSARYDSLDTIETSSPPVVYIFISIMSHLFTYGPSLEHMVAQVEQTYGRSSLPIIFACGNTIYNITQKWFLSDVNSQELLAKRINLETKKWDKVYRAAISNLKADSSKHKTLYWDEFEAIQEYAQFKRFTDAVLFVAPELSVSSLQKQFPEIEDSPLFGELIQSIQDSQISNDIVNIVDNYIKKNEESLRKAADDGERKDQEFQAQSLKRGTEFIPVEPGLEQRKNGLKTDSVKFLANEYAVFLLLSYLSNVSELNEKLQLQLPPSLLKSISSVQPISIYPIKSSNSELTFVAYAKIRKLYDQYSQRLCLLPIQKPAVFLNSPVPLEVAYPAQITNSHRSSKNNGAANEVGRNEGLSLSVSTQAAIVDSKKSDIYSPQSAQKSTFYPSVIDAKTITDKIINIILTHKQAGVKTRKISFRNVITCEIKVLDNKYDVDNNGTSIEVMRPLITDAIATAEQYDDTIIFHHKGAFFSLHVSPYETNERSKTSSPENHGETISGLR